MMKTRFIILLLVGLTACHEQPAGKAPSTVIKQNSSTKTIQYTCPMHPEVVTNKPGTCPKCGMDLVEKTK